MRILPLVLLLAALPAAGQQPAEAPKTAALEGRVVNARTGEPVRRVNLTLRSAAPGRVAIMGPQDSSAYAATTDADGKFRIEKIEPGRYTLYAERQGFVRQAYGARRAGMQGTTIALAAGQELKAIDFKLTPQAVIAGRVVDEEGEPLANVSIQALRRSWFQGEQRLMPTGGGQTNDMGEFRISGLAPGRYWVSASYRARMMTFGTTPAPAADKPQEEYVTTYCPGTADRAAARPFDLAAGQELPGIDIRMQKSRVYRIRGKVAGEAAPRGIRIMLMPREPGSFGFPGGGNMVRQDGTFEIANVAPGSYFVTAVPMTEGMARSAGRVPVDVVREDVENVSLALAPGAEIKGSVRIEGASQPEPQAAGEKSTLAGVRVQFLAAEGMSFGSAGAVAGADGQFTLPGVLPDRYRVNVSTFPPGTWLKSIRYGDQEVADGILDLGAGAAGTLQVTLSTGAGEIGGTVQDDKQQPAGGAVVTIVPDPPKPSRQDLYRQTTTDQNGHFTLPDLAPGDYKLYAWDALDWGAQMDPDFLKPHESKAQKVTVKPGSRQQAALPLIAAETP